MVYSTNCVSLSIAMVILHMMMQSYAYHLEDPLRFRRVINDQIAVQHSRPWVIQLRRDGEHICGAALIMRSPNHFDPMLNGSSDVLITAAHCVIQSTSYSFDIQYGINPKRITAHFGKHNSTTHEDWETVINVKHVIIHPRYERNNDGYDIAIIKLEREIEFNDIIRPIALSPFPLDSVADCSVAGWGRRLELPSDTDPNAVLTVLQLADIRDSSAVYVANISSIEKTMWTGDSGSPLTCSHNEKIVVQGVASKITRVIDYDTMEITKVNEGIFTSVPDNIAWINQSLARIDDQPVLYHTEFSKYTPFESLGSSLSTNLDEELFELYGFEDVKREIPLLSPHVAVLENYVRHWFNDSIYNVILVENGMLSLDTVHGYVKCQQPAQCAVMCYKFNSGRPCGYSINWGRCYFASTSYVMRDGKFDGLSIRFPK